MAAFKATLLPLTFGIASLAAASCVLPSSIGEAEAKKVAFQQCKDDWRGDKGHYAFLREIGPEAWNATRDGAGWTVYAGRSRNLCQFVVNISADGHPARCRVCLNPGE